MWVKTNRARLFAVLPVFAAGQTVIVALPGARIADNVKIKKAKCGEESLAGMICALQENRL